MKTYPAIANATRYHILYFMAEQMPYFVIFTISVWWGERGGNKR